MFPETRKTLKPIEGSGEEIGPSVGGQGGDKGSLGGNELFHGVIRDVAFVENQRGVPTLADEGFVASQQFFREFRKQTDIRNVSRIGSMKQWDLKVSGNQEGQPNLTQVVTLALERPRCARSMRSLEVATKVKKFVVS